MHNPVMRDRIGEVLTFREDPGSIRRGLEEPALGLVLKALMDGVATGRFHAFTRAGHISAKAARALIAPLARGWAIRRLHEVGYDDAKRVEVRLEDVRIRWLGSGHRNGEAGPAMAHEYGACPISSMSSWRATSARRRGTRKITKGIEDRNKERDKARQRLEEEIWVVRPVWKN